MRTLRRLESLPPAIPLAAIVMLAAVPTVAYVTGLTSYFIMPDELGYVKQSAEIAERLFLLTPGDAWFNSWAQLQPLTAAPAYGLFETPVAFDVAHVVNALVMASTAIPAYLLARPLVPSRLWAYAAAALSVAIPWLAMAGTLMTEVTAYPVFTWAVFGMVRAIARPSIGRDVLALVLIGLSFLARTQFAVLGPLFFAAILIHELNYGMRADRGGAPGRRVALALHRSLTSHPAAVVAAGAGAVGAFALGMDSLLGSYSGIGGGTLLPAGTLAASREMLAYIVVGVGVLPLVVSAPWAVMSLARPASPETHAFAVVLVLVVAVLTVMAGSFTVQYTNGINDRYLFYIAPLLFAGMVAGLTAGRRVAVPVAITGTLVGWLIFASELDEAGVTLISPSAAFHLVLDGRAYDVGRVIGNDDLTSPTLVGVLTVVGAIGFAAALWSRWRASVAAVATVGVLTYGALETNYVLDKIEATQAGVGQEFLDNRAWADELLPGDARAAAVLGALDDFGTTAVVFRDLLFWNRQVDRVAIAEGDPIYDQPFHTRFTFDPETGDLDGLDHRAYLVRALGDVRFGLRGTQALDSRNLLILERAPRPYTAAWAVLGAGARGKVPAGETVGIRVYGDGRARTREVRVAVASTFDAGRAYGYRLEGGEERRSGRIARAETGRTSVRLRVPARGHVDLAFTVLPSGKPIEGGPGLRIEGVSLDPPA